MYTYLLYFNKMYSFLANRVTSFCNYIDFQILKYNKLKVLLSDLKNIGTN